MSLTLHPPAWIRHQSDGILELVTEFGFDPFRAAVVEWVRLQHVEVQTDYWKKRREWAKKEHRQGRFWSLHDINEVFEGGRQPPGCWPDCESDEMQLERVYVGLEGVHVLFPPELRIEVPNGSDPVERASTFDSLDRLERLTLLSAIHDRCQHGAEYIDPWSIQPPPEIDGTRYWGLIWDVPNLFASDLFAGPDNPAGIGTLPPSEESPGDEVERYMRNMIDRVRGELASASEELGSTEGSREDRLNGGCRYQYLHKQDIRRTLGISRTELQNRIKNNEIPIHPEDRLRSDGTLSRKKQIRVGSDWVLQLNAGSGS